MYYQSDFFIFLFEIILILIKNIKELINKNILLNIKIQMFRKLNKILNKYRYIKKP